jgi:hypothetical protein
VSDFPFFGRASIDRRQFCARGRIRSARAVAFGRRKHQGIPGIGLTVQSRLNHDIRKTRRWLNCQQRLTSRSAKLGCREAGTCRSNRGSTRIVGVSRRSIKVRSSLARRRAGRVMWMSTDESGSSAGRTPACPITGTCKSIKAGSTSMSTCRAIESDLTRQR